MKEYQLIQFHKKELKGAEAKEVQDWIGHSPENEAYYEDVIQIWEAAANAAVFGNIKDHTGSAKKINTNRSYGLYRWMQYAAMFIVALATGYYLYNMSVNPKIEYAEFTNTQGSNQMILADGSTVTLKDSSKLVYAKEFKGKNRFVKLEGTAFFEITKNPEKPFIIESNQAKIEVLGTSFLVDNKDNTTKVSVNTGKVKLSNKEKKEAIILKKGEEGLLDGNHVEKLKAFDPNKLSWKTGVFDFNNIELAKALNLLNDYYKKPITIKLNQRIDRRLTAYFDREDQQTILETLEYSIGLKIEDKGKYFELSMIE